MLTFVVICLVLGALVQANAHSGITKRVDRIERELRAARLSVRVKALEEAVVVGAPAGSAADTPPEANAPTAQQERPGEWAAASSIAPQSVVPAPLPLAAPREPRPTLPPLPPPAAPVVSATPLLKREIGGRTIESLLAEHALSIVGGLFVLVSAALFLTYAINQGWIGEGLRTLLAGGFGVGLFAAGLRLAQGLTQTERDGRALGSAHGVLAGTGTAVMFATSVVATRLYDLVPPTAGVVIAIAVGAAAVLVAVRWRSQDLAAFGVGGSLLSPMMVGAPVDVVTAAFLGVALIAAVYVAVREDWPRLVALAALVTAPQMLEWVDQTTAASEAGPLVGLFAWWALLIGAVVWRGWHDAGAQLRRSDIATLFLAGAAVVGGVEFWCTDAGSEWRPGLLAVLAALHVAPGAALLRGPGRSNPLLGSLLIVSAASLLAAAVGDAQGGAAVAAAWAFEAAGLAILWMRTRDVVTAVIGVGLGAMAMAHLLFIEGPPIDLLTGSSNVGELVIGFVSILAAVMGADAYARRADVARLARVLDGVAAVTAIWFGALLAASAATIDATSTAGATAFDPSAQQWVGAFLGSCALACSAVFRRTARDEWLAFTAALAVIAPAWMISLNVWTAHGVFIGSLVAAGVAVALLHRWRSPEAAALAGWAALLATIHALVSEAPLNEAVGTGLDSMGMGLAALGAVMALWLAVRAAVSGTLELRHVGSGAELVGLTALALLAGAPFVWLGVGADPFPASDLGRVLPALIWTAVAAVAALLVARGRLSEPVATWSSVITGLAALSLLLDPTDVRAAVACLAIQSGALAWPALAGVRATSRSADPLALGAFAVLVAEVIAAVAAASPAKLIYGVGSPGTVLPVWVIVVASIGVTVVLLRRALDGSSLSQDLRALVSGVLRATTIAGTVAGVYLASLAVVAAFTSSAGMVEQDAQVALSTLWGILGVAGLAAAAGARWRDSASLRHSAYALLGLAATKVILFDTSALGTPSRVLVFLSVGVLLLGGAALEQRLRRQM